jgi:uncharacterized protein (DUF342 family)
MDFFDRELLKPAHPGDLLGSMVPARRGTAGTRVDGGSHVAPHVPGVNPRMGPGVTLHADGRVTATLAGTIVYRPPELLDVVEHYVHEGHVDVRSGHLSTEGSLVVGGDVKRTFGVRALGDLEIRGAVESGSVYAGGNIRVHGAVGGGDGLVSACGNLTASHAERTTLVSGGLLTLDDSVYCTLRAKAIRVLHGLHGGRATAELRIVAEQAGSPRGNAETFLVAGVPLDPPELVAYPVIVQTVYEIAALPHRESERPLGASSLVMLATKPPARNSETPARRSAAPEGRLTSIPPQTGIATSRPRASASPARPSTTPALSTEEVARAEAERAAVREARAEQLLQAASIQIFGVAHAGVTIQIGDVRMVLDAPMQQVRFSLDVKEKKIRISRPER